MNTYEVRFENNFEELLKLSLLLNENFEITIERDGISNQGLIY